MSAPTAQTTPGHQQSGATAARDPAYTASATKDPVTDAAVGKSATKFDDAPHNSAAEMAAFNLAQGAEKLRDNVAGIGQYVNETATNAASQAMDAVKSTTSPHGHENNTPPAPVDTPAPPPDPTLDAPHTNAAGDAATSAAQYLRDNASAVSQHVKDTLGGIASQPAPDTGDDLAARTDAEATRKADQLQASVDAAGKPHTFVPSASEKADTTGKNAYDAVRDTLSYVAEATQNRAAQVAEYARQDPEAGNGGAQEQSGTAQDASGGVAGGVQDAMHGGAQKVQRAHEAGKTAQGDALRE